MSPDRARASGVVFLRGGPRVSVLLVHQDYGLRLWTTPGGTLEPGETPMDAAVREVREELGIEPKIDGPILTVEIVAPTPRTGYIFTGIVPDGYEPAITDDELDGVGWFFIDDLPAPLAPWLEVILDDVLAGRTGGVRSFREPS